MKPNRIHLIAAVTAVLILAIAAQNAGARLLTTAESHFSPHALNTSAQAQMLFKLDPNALALGDDVRQATLLFPAGFDVSPNRMPGRCNAMQFLGFVCPANSRIGSVFIHMREPNGSLTLFSGGIFVVPATAGSDRAGSTGSVGLGLKSPDGRMYWVGGELFGTPADGQNLDFMNFPIGASTGSRAVPIEIADFWSIIDANGVVRNPSQCGIYRSIVTVRTYTDKIEGFFNDHIYTCGQTT